MIFQEFQFESLTLVTNQGIISESLLELGLQKRAERYHALDGTFVEIQEDREQKMHGAQYWVTKISFRLFNKQQVYQLSLSLGVNVVESDGRIAISYSPQWAMGNFEIELFFDTLSKATFQSKIETVDHVAIAIEVGASSAAVATFEEILGLCQEGDAMTVVTKDSGMKMTTMKSLFGLFRVVLVEPLDGSVGQVYDFVSDHGPGIQHFAFLTNDIISVVQSLDKTKLSKFPVHSWDDTIAKVSVSASDDANLFDEIIKKRDLGIIVDVRVASGDSNDIGVLSQVFTSKQFVTSHGFFELIERKNYEGFASKNIGALFKGKESSLSILFVDEILGSYDDWREDLNLRDVDLRITHFNCTNKDQLLQILTHTTAKFDIIVSSFIPIDEEVLTLLQHRPILVQAQGAGYNHIDREYCMKNSIEVRNNPGWCGDEVAEYTLACISMSAAEMVEYQSSMKAGIWDRSLVARHSLKGAILAVLGYGKIGNRIAHLARGFGLNVLVFDPFVTDASLNDVLSQADYVSINVPLNDATKGMINQKSLKELKHGSVIINTSRGGVVDEESILKALDFGAVKSYFTDVFENEPETDSKLLKHPNVYATPHIAGKTIESEKQASWALIKNFEMVLTALYPHKVQGSDSKDPLMGLRTMRDIFDRFGREAGMINLAAGMVEFIPPMALRTIASDLVLKEETGNLSEIRSFHMYRERKGDTIYRHAVQLLEQQEHGNLIDMDMILGTSGVSAAIVSVFQAVKASSSGNVVTLGLFTPFYTYHSEIAFSVFGKDLNLKFIKLKDDMTIDFDELERYLPMLDLLVFTNPGNPTTLALKSTEIAKFESLAKNYPLCTFVSDEVYSDMIVPGTILHSFEAPYLENIVVCRGFSKSLAIGSWRVGYALAHPETIERLATEHDRIYICQNWTQMAVGRYIIENYSNFKEYILDQRQTLQQNADTLTQAFTSIGWTPFKRDGSMYLLIKHGCKSDTEAFYQMKDCGVLVVPGYMLAEPNGQYNTGLIRVHYAMDSEKVGLASMKIRALQLTQ